MTQKKAQVREVTAIHVRSLSFEKFEAVVEVFCGMASGAHQVTKPNQHFALAREEVKGINAQLVQMPQGLQQCH